MTTYDQQISPPSLPLKFQTGNFTVIKFPKQQRWKEYPRENNKMVLEAWEYFSQTRRGGEFWGWEVIMHKAYWKSIENG